MKKISLKRSLLILTGVAAISLSTSCNKILQDKPYSTYTTSTFFQTTDQTTMAILGIYGVLSNQNSYGFYMSLLYSLDTDIGQMQGTGFSNDSRIVAHYGYTPTEPDFEHTWELLYEGVDRANLAIQRIPEMALYKNGTSDQKATLSRLLAEAHFLRGFIYFDLVKLWGDVPLKLTPSLSPNANFKLPNTNREIIYDSIISDITQAIPYIPWPSQKPVDERVNKGAVMGILARVYLYRAGYSLRADGQMERPQNYMDYYKAAIPLLDSIQQSGEYMLNPSYQQLFMNYCQGILDPKSSMFEVSFYNPTGTSTHTGFIGTWNSPICSANSSYGRANSFYKTTPLFYKSFGNGDLRRDVAIATFQINADNSITQLTGKNDAKWAPGKWRRNWQTLPALNPNNTDINWVLLRYADVLLMRAEAENELNGGPDAAAYDAINQVRKRAGLGPLPAGLSQQAFFNDIVIERAHELCFEGLRKWDLIRWNMLGQSLRNAQDALMKYRKDYPYQAGTTFTDDKNELYPIPQREIDQDPNLKQNPGY